MTVYRQVSPPLNLGLYNELALLLCLNSKVYVKQDETPSYKNTCTLDFTCQIHNGNKMKPCTKRNCEPLLYFQSVSIDVSSGSGASKLTQCLSENK